MTVDAEDEEVAELMEFFKNSNGINEKFKNLSERVDELKNEESEVQIAEATGLSVDEVKKLRVTKL